MSINSISCMTWLSFPHSGSKKRSAPRPWLWCPPSWTWCLWGRWWWSWSPSLPGATGRAGAIAMTCLWPCWEWCGSSWTTLCRWVLRGRCWRFVCQQCADLNTSSSEGIRYSWWMTWDFPERVSSLSSWYEFWFPQCTLTTVRHFTVWQYLAAC